VGARLYLAAEQLDRVVARVYGLPSPALPILAAEDSRTYSVALETWVGEHPFLDGTATKPSSAVFEAAMTAHALKHESTSNQALEKELRRGSASNPFLAELYFPPSTTAPTGYIPPEHIGIIYASLRGRLSIGDKAALTIDGESDEGDEEIAALKAEVEITLERKDDDVRSRLLNFETDQTGSIRLGSYLEDIDIISPLGRRLRISRLQTSYS